MADQTKSIRIKPSSAKAISTLRYISQKKLSLEDAQGVTEVTLWSLLKRGYIVVQGTNIVLTNEGHFVLSAYSSTVANWRNNRGEFSERVQTLLQVAKRKLKETA